jgi:hypothetical protein
MKTIALLVLALLPLTGCAASVEADAPSSGPPSCDLLAAGEWEQVWAFSDHDTAAPVGTACLSLGGGMFTCKPEACLEVGIAGTCPHCPGGGE